MRHDESQLLVQTAKNTVQLFQDRDDMLVGITAALLDLYRVGFQHGQQTKEEALARLQMQSDFLEKNEPRHRGVLFLNALIVALRDEKLDASKLLREPPAGSA